MDHPVHAYIFCNFSNFILLPLLFYSPIFFLHLRHAVVSLAICALSCFVPTAASFHTSEWHNMRPREFLINCFLKYWTFGEFFLANKIK